MKKQLIAVMLSLSMLAFGGTALAANNPTPAKKHHVKIESKSTLSIKKAGKTAAASVSTQKAAQAAGAVQKDGSLNAGVSVKKSADKSVQSAASTSVKGSIGGTKSVDGNSAIDVQKNSSGEAVVNANADLNLNGSLLDVSTGVKIQVSNGENEKAISLEYNGQGSTTKTGLK